MKFAFLDIDGVMNPGIVHNPLDMGTALMPEHVSVLNHIIAHTGALVVISSAFRLGKSLPDIREEFKKAGFTGEIVGKTPSFGSRDDEILAFLEKNPAESYVVIDDMTFMGKVAKRHVCTYPSGLTMEHVQPILSVLG
jgi:hypothetical protein